MGESIERDDLGGVDLVQLRQALAHCVTQQETGQALELFAQSLLEQSVIGQNDLMQHLLERPMATVEDVMRSSGYSRRHIQRLIRQRVGYSPHDFIRIIRFQRTLTSMRADAYADQPHFIREFKRITGMTPGEFKERYVF